MKKLTSILHKIIIALLMLANLFIPFLRNGYCAFDNLFTIDLEPHSCDQLITYDLISNREWINLREAINLSYNDLVGPNHDCNPTCTRGEFEGWTLSSVEDVINFIGDAGIYYGNTDSYSLIRSFIGSYVGVTGASPWFNFQEATGITRDLASPTKVIAVQLSTGGSRPYSSTPTPTYTLIEVDVDGNILGSAWLYRPSSLSSPYANFCASTTSGLAPLIVNFYYRSYQANSWLWDFGDGTTSTEQDPIHTYANPGSYTVSLTVTGVNGSDTDRVEDYILVQPPTFSDAANTEIIANFNSDVFVYNWNTTYSDYENMKYYLGESIDASEKAYAQANIATNQNTSFWGYYAQLYMEAELKTRSAALPYVDIAQYYASYGNVEMAEYYSAYAFSLNALADLYNGSAIWCCSIEGNLVGNPSADFPASPSFYSAAYYGWLANINYATSLGYLSAVVSNPAYFPLIQLYASTAYDYAQVAYNEAFAALAAAGTDYTVWALNAVQYAANDMGFRSESVSYINSAVLSYQQGDIETAYQLLVQGYGRGQYADAENAKMIWCASMESKGGKR
jgi:hypothetical protein